MKFFLTELFILCLIFLPGCGSQESNSAEPTAVVSPTNTPTPIPTPAPTVNPYYKSGAGGEPRTTGYWLLWNSCAPDNRADVAAANGGRAAGWIILDDLLVNPGIVVGNLLVTDCVQAVNLLNYKDIFGEEKTDDLTYSVAAQLLAAQLNLAAGAVSCPAAEDALNGGQLYLVGLGFTGAGDYTPEDTNPVSTFIENLQQYNLGNLCQ